jgi:hypothetical protein
MRNLLFVPLILALALPVLAQNPPGPGPAAQALRYDPGTEVNLSGRVRAVRTPPAGPVRLVVNAGWSRVILVAAPPRFLVNQGASFTPGEVVTFVGSRIYVQGRTVVLAREITGNGRTLVLRDHQGIPAWRPMPGQGPGPDQGQGQEQGQAQAPAAGEVEDPIDLADLN